MIEYVGDGAEGRWARGQGVEFDISFSHLATEEEAVVEELDRLGRLSRRREEHLRTHVCVHVCMHVCTCVCMYTPLASSRRAVDHTHTQCTDP